MNPLQTVLSIMQLALDAAQLYPNAEVDTVAAFAAKMEAIAQNALTAHQQATGQPIDLTKLLPIPLIPDPTAAAPAATATDASQEFQQIAQTIAEQPEAAAPAAESVPEQSADAPAAPEAAEQEPAAPAAEVVAPTPMGPLHGTS